MHNIDILPRKAVINRSEKVGTMLAYDLAIAIGLAAFFIFMGHMGLRRIGPLDSKLLLPLALLIFVAFAIANLQSVVNRIEIGADEICLFYLMPSGFSKRFALATIQVDYGLRSNGRSGRTASLRGVDKITRRTMFDIDPGMSGFSEAQLKEINSLLNERIGILHSSALGQSASHRPLGDVAPPALL